MHWTKLFPLPQSCGTARETGRKSTREGWEIEWEGARKIREGRREGEGRGGSEREEKGKKEGEGRKREGRRGRRGREICRCQK